MKTFLSIVLCSTFLMACASREIKPTKKPEPKVMEGWERYKSESIKGVIDKHKNSDADSIILAAHYPFRTKVIFNKQLISLTLESEKVLNGFVASQGHKETAKMYADKFKNELLVVQDREEYWVPIQDALLPHLAEELKPGDEFYIYATLAGRVEGKWVFLINEFQALE